MQKSTRGILAPKGVFKVVRVYDGDTFTILGDDGLRYNIRINGIDAPERGQQDGLYAREYLIALIDNQPVTIIPMEVDCYGRTIATCYTADNKDISYEMLIAGMVWHYSAYDNTSKYITAEKDARYMSLGIWGNGEAIPPQEYRSLKRTQRLKYK